MLGEWSGCVLSDVPGCGQYTVLCVQCHEAFFYERTLITLSLSRIFLLTNCIRNLELEGIVARNHSS